MLDQLLRGVRADELGRSASTIEVSGIFFGSPPGLSLSADRVKLLSDLDTSLSITLRTTVVGPLGHETAQHADGAERSTVSVSYRVKGMFEPDEFSNRVGLQPTKTSRRQEHRRLMARFSTWRIELGPFVAQEFPTSATDELLDRVLPHAGVLHSTVQATSTRAAIHFAARYGVVVPALHVTREQVRRIGALGCWLDFSILVLREDAEHLEF